MLERFIKTPNLPLIAILILAAFLRLYKLSETFIMIPETGADLTIARDAILTHTIPLHGVVTSHTWLYFGPIYWWLLELFSFIFSFSSISHAILGRLGSFLIALMVYLLLKRIINVRTALLSTLLVAVSPLFLANARIGRHDSFSTLFSLIFIYILSYSNKKKFENPFLTGLVLGVGINFEYTFILLAPVFASFIFLRKLEIKMRQIAVLLLGLFIPFTPLILLELFSGKPMLIKLALWIPYRILGFLGIIKNTIDVPSFAPVSYSFWKLISDSFIPTRSLPTTVLLALPVLAALFILVQKFFTKKITSGELLLLLIAFWYVIGLVIHTNPPTHYFAEIFFVPIVLICYLANFYWDRGLVKLIFLLLVGSVIVLNLRYYFSTQWFYKNFENEKTSYISQKNLAEAIIHDANGMPYSLKRVGALDDFPNNFADNYIYLLWYYGNAPVANSKLQYIIYDDRVTFEKARLQKTSFIVGPIGVIKNEK